MEKTPVGNIRSWVSIEAAGGKVIELTFGFLRYHKAYLFKFI